MNAAVLCPGASVQRYPKSVELRVSEACTVPRAYDLVVGVNRAAGLFPCDFWCLLDHYTFNLKPTVIGRPTIVCHASIRNSMTKEFPDAKLHKHIALETLDPDPDIDPELAKNCIWRTWSASLAIIVAFVNGAAVVDCYGMDWRGTDDWDGFNHPQHRRGTRRWVAEQHLFEKIQDWLAGLGCVVRRVCVT